MQQCAEVPTELFACWLFAWSCQRFPLSYSIACCSFWGLAGDVAIADTGLYIVAPHSLAACRTAKVAEYQTYSVAWLHLNCPVFKCLALATYYCKLAIARPPTRSPKPESPYLQPCIGLTGWAWQEWQESRLFVFVYPFSLCNFLTSFIKIEFGKQCKQVSIDFGWWGLCPWNALGVTSCISHIFPVLESTGAQLFGRSRRSWFMRGFCASSEIEDESLWMFGYKSIRQYMHCMYARSYFLRPCDNVQVILYDVIHDIWKRWALYVLNTGSPTICIFMPHHVYLFMSQPECSVNTWYQIGRPTGQLDERIQQAKPTVLACVAIFAFSEVCHEVIPRSARRLFDYLSGVTLGFCWDALGCFRCICLHFC